MTRVARRSAASAAFVAVSLALASVYAFVDCADAPPLPPPSPTDAMAPPGTDALVGVEDAAPLRDASLARDAAGDPPELDAGADDALPLL